MKKDQNGRQGIIAGGNWIVDHIKTIDAWPPQDALANIVGETWGNGGAPYNTLKDLAKLGATFPLQGIGLVGDDPDGRRIVDDCGEHGIDTTQLRPVAAATSYSDVMTDQRNGRRTFFHQRGANALLAPSHFDFSRTTARFFHLGYLMLLDSLDSLEDGIPRTAQVLRQARAAGLITSVDCVSENSDRFQSLVRPVLPEVDILFVNDFEAERISGVQFRSDPLGKPMRMAVEAAARKLIEFGVRQRVIIHYPEAVFEMDTNRVGHWQASLALPSWAIKGTAGAGDALASGILYALHEEWPAGDALRLGVCAAASSLTDSTCSGGVLTAPACMALGDVYSRNELPT
jgi:sugar/nucleoside kinase (ribokinase family)